MGSRPPGGGGARGVALLLAWVLAGLPARAAALPPTGAPPAGAWAGAPWRLEALRLTVADDHFRRADDSGFTSYQAVELELSRGPRERLGLLAGNQMITERGGMRRVDEGLIAATYGRRVVSSRLEVELGLLLGASVLGDLGGAHLQDGYHALLGGGRRLDGSLQDRYPGRTRVGLVPGAELRARWPAGAAVALTAGVGGRADVGGGGVSRLHGSLGLALVAGRVRVEAGDAVWRFLGGDPFLTMPGGYRTGALVHAPYLRVGVGVRGLALEYEARANAGGSGQGMSQLGLRIPLR